MLVVPPMLPRAYLSGLSNSSESGNGEPDTAPSAAALNYARAAAASALTSPASLSADGNAQQNAALLESIILQEQQKQALLASQLSVLNANAAASDRLGALMMQRESLLGGGGGGVAGWLEQNALQRLAAASGGNLGLAGLTSPLGLSGFGGIGNPLARGLLAGTPSSMLLGTQTQSQQLQGQRDTASLVPDHLVPLLDRSDGSGRKGRTGTFPQKLHLMLSDLESEEGGRDIASWLPHGRAFAIHKPKEFVKSIMPKYFRMSRFSSFQRQLNLYEFQRITEGPDKGAYFHELFLHGRPMLCTQIKRNKIKGTQGSRPAANQNAPLGPAFGVFPLNASGKAGGGRSSAAPPPQEEG